jgi:hypothetical protein
LIQHTISTTFNSLKIYFNEIYLFQNSPVQPLPFQYIAAFIVSSRRVYPGCCW